MRRSCWVMISSPTRASGQARLFAAVFPFGRSVAWSFRRGQDHLGVARRLADERPAAHWPRAGPRLEGGAGSSGRATAARPASAGLLAALDFSRLDGRIEGDWRPGHSRRGAGSGAGLIDGPGTGWRPASRRAGSQAEAPRAAAASSTAAGLSTAVALRPAALPVWRQT